MTRNWSHIEVKAAVDTYFKMLRLELSGLKYNKTEHRNALVKRLDQRSNGSIELKHQNISAVLIDMGIPAPQQNLWVALGTGRSPSP